MEALEKVHLAAIRQKYAQQKVKIVNKQVLKEKHPLPILKTNTFLLPGLHVHFIFQPSWWAFAH